ncbi:MAG TPA: hypothetical protein VEK55_15255, partial [Xanthobacteraceae bacterium]|nr:hypothetical protein [Xanthobacteraceae bacterium]
MGRRRGLVSCCLVGMRDALWKHQHEVHPRVPNSAHLTRIRGLGQDNFIAAQMIVADFEYCMHSGQRKSPSS